MLCGCSLDEVSTSGEAAQTAPTAGQEASGGADADELPRAAVFQEERPISAETVLEWVLLVCVPWERQIPARNQRCPERVHVRLRRSHRFRCTFVNRFKFVHNFPSRENGFPLRNCSETHNSEFGNYFSNDSEVKIRSLSTRIVQKTANSS